MTSRRRAALIAAVFVPTLALSATPAVAAPGPPGAPQYYFDDWKVKDLWDDGARGKGITIAAIDTGVNADLPELRNRVLRGTDTRGNGDGRTDKDIEEFGHGTAMASIMVARSGLFDITGLAPDAKVLPVAVPLNGTRDSDNPDRLPEAIRYSADHGAKIISMSLGGKRDPSRDTESCPDDEQAAIFHAISKGAIVFAAVGNSGPTKNPVEEPGVCLGVVSVGAVDDNGKVAKFSTRQPYLTMTAPGVEIASLSRVRGSAFSGDGTSQATAVASAVAAMVWSKYPNLTGRDVVTRLLATLDKSGIRGHSNSYGYGRLDAERAVRASVPTTAANPVYATATPFLARAAALDAEPPAAPKPVAASRAETGTPEIADVSRWTSQVVLGIAITVVGLIVLVLLLLLRRARRRPDAPAPIPVTSYGGGPTGSPH